MNGNAVEMLMEIAGAALLAGLALWAWLHWRDRRLRRRILLASELSPQARQYLVQQFPIYARLPDDIRNRLDGLVHRFIDEVKFVGRDGFEVTDAARLVIAAQACLLIVNRPQRWFPTLKSVILYPAPFKSKAPSGDPFIEGGDPQVNVGESWMRGPVVLAYDHAVYGAFQDRDGHNVVLHEFAHQLDEATGASDGAPLLDPGQDARQWAHAFQTAYARLQADAERARPSVFDHYGALAPAEFFAVAVETFFEKPQALKMEEPAIYDELARYFGMDPVGW